MLHGVLSVSFKLVQTSRHAALPRHASEVNAHLISRTTCLLRIDHAARAGPSSRIEDSGPTRNPKRDGWARYSLPSRTSRTRALLARPTRAAGSTPSAAASSRLHSAG